MWRRVSSFEVMTGCEPIECRPWKACETRSCTRVEDPLLEEEKQRKNKEMHRPFGQRTIQRMEERKCKKKEKKRIKKAFLKNEGGVIVISANPRRVSSVGKGVAL
jgi:hypothetical protein